MVNDVTEIKIDVEVLKEKVDNITQLCNKMDSVIDKLVNNHDRMVNQMIANAPEAKGRFARRKTASKAAPKKAAKKPAAKRKTAAKK